MGCFFSSLLSSADGGGPPPAMVVTTDGYLLEYDSGITAAEVIARTSAPDLTLCNADKIFFDCYPQAAQPGEELEPGQIYFLLPAAELRRRLTGEVVAELAVRAGEALRRAQEKHGSRRKIRVAPGTAEEEFGGDYGGGGGGGNMRRWSAAEWRRMECYDGNGFVKLRKELSVVEEVDDEGGLNLLFH